MHQIQLIEHRIGAGERGGDDGEVLGDIVGDAEGGERAARHQHLFAGFDDLDQLGGVGVEIHHVARFLGRLGAGIHGDGYIRLGQRRRVIGAIPGHGHQTTLLLMFPDQFQLHFGRRLGQKIIHAGLGGDGGGGDAVIAGDHDGLDAHAAQFGEALLDSALHDVLEFDDPQNPGTLGDGQRRAAATRDLIDECLDGLGKMAALLYDEGLDGIRRTLANLPGLAHRALRRQVHAAHPAMRAEGHEYGVEGAHIPLAYPEYILRKHHDAAAFGGLIGQGSQLRRVRQPLFGDA